MEPKVFSWVVKPDQQSLQTLLEQCKHPDTLMCLLDPTGEINSQAFFHPQYRNCVLMIPQNLEVFALLKNLKETVRLVESNGRIRLSIETFPKILQDIGRNSQQFNTTTNPELINSQAWIQQLGQPVVKQSRALLFIHSAEFYFFCDRNSLSEIDFRQTFQALINRVKTKTHDPITRDVFQYFLNWAEFRKTVESQVEEFADQPTRDYWSSIPQILAELQAPIDERVATNMTLPSYDAGRMSIEQVANNRQQNIDSQSISPVSNFSNLQANPQIVATDMLIPEIVNSPSKSNEKEFSINGSQILSIKSQPGQPFKIKLHNSSRYLHPVVQENYFANKNHIFLELREICAKAIGTAFGSEDVEGIIKTQIISIVDSSRFRTLNWVTRLDLLVDLQPAVQSSVTEHLKLGSRKPFCTAIIWKCSCKAHEECGKFTQAVANVLMDESYLPFSEPKTWSSLLRSFPNSHAYTKQLILSELKTVMNGIFQRDLEQIASEIKPIVDGDTTSASAKIGYVMVAGFVKAHKKLNPLFVNKKALSSVNWEKLFDQYRDTLRDLLQSPDKSLFEALLYEAIKELEYILEDSKPRYEAILTAYLNKELKSRLSQDEYFNQLLKLLAENIGSEIKFGTAFTEFSRLIRDPNNKRNWFALVKAHPQIQTLSNTSKLWTCLFQQLDPVLKCKSGNCETLENLIAQGSVSSNIWQGIEILEGWAETSVPFKLYKYLDETLVILWNWITDSKKPTQTLEMRIKNHESYVKFFEKVPLKFRIAQAGTHNLKELFGQHRNTCIEINKIWASLNKILASWRQLIDQGFIVAEDKTVKELTDLLSTPKSLNELQILEKPFQDGFQHATRVTMLWKSEAYKNALKKQRSGKDSTNSSGNPLDQPITLKELQKLAAETESKMIAAVQSLTNSVTEGGANNLRNYLQDKHFDLVVEHLGIQSLITEAKQMCSWFWCLKDFSNQTKVLKEILSKILQSGRNSQDAKAVECLQVLSEEVQKTNQFVKSDQSKLDGPAKALLGVLGRDHTLLPSLHKLPLLVDHFKNKEATHFQNLIFSPNLQAAGLNAKNIVGVQELMEYIRKLLQGSQKPSLVAFLELLTPSSTTEKVDEVPSSNLVVLSKLEGLLEISENLLKGIESGTEEIQAMMKRSTVYFDFNKAKCYYEVYARLPKNEEKTNRRQNGPTRSQSKQDISFEKMKANKMQMAITTQAGSEIMDIDENSSPKQVRRLAAHYVRAVDAIESIKTSLESLMGLGAIFNLEAHFKKELRHIDQLIEAERLKENEALLETQVASLNTWSVLSQISFENFSIQVMLEPSVSTGEPQLDSLLALQRVLLLVLNNARIRSLNQGNNHHSINRLKGQQKVLQCQYFKKMLKPNSDEAEFAKSLCQYTLDKIVAPPQVEESQDFQKLTLTDEILDYYYNIIQKSSKLPVTVSSNETGSNRKIAFIGTEPQSKFRELLKILCACSSDSRGLKQHPSQFFIAENSTTSEQLFSFLTLAAQDPTGRLYFMIDLHLLKDSVSDTFRDQLKQVYFRGVKTTRNYNLVLMLQKKLDRNSLYSELLKSSTFFTSVEEVFPNLKKTQVQEAALNTLLREKKVTVVSSGLPGLGKSEAIFQKAKSTGLNIVTINVSGDPSDDGINRRLTIIKEAAAIQQEFILHVKLDMWENLETNCERIDSFLFQLCYLRCVNYLGGYLFLDCCNHIYLEVQNTCKDVIIKNLSWLKLLNAFADTSVYIHPVGTPDNLVARFNLATWGQEATKAEAIHAILENFESFLAFDPEQNENHSLIEFCLTQPKRNYQQGLIRAIMGKVNQRIMADSDLLQFRTFIRVVYDQLVEAQKVPALSLKIHDPQAQPRILELKRNLFNSLIANAAELTWSSAEKIRLETKKTTDTLKQLDQPEFSNQTEVKKLLEMYKRTVVAIPDWCKSNITSYFFGSTALKVIYSDLSNVSQQIKNIIRDLTGEDLKDYGKLSNPHNELLNELGTSLFERCDSAELKKLAKEFSNGKGFNVTPDNFNKILMVIQRAHLHIPIVVMGPTGCGKTYLVQFIAEALLQDLFFNITLHPGVTEDMLVSRLEEACELAEQLLALEAVGPHVEEQPPKFVRLHSSKKVWVLFDEFNTSHLQCLVAEIMITRKSTFSPRLVGREFPENLVFVAACNPFKIEPAKMSNVGLTNESKLRVLSHRVYKIPDSLLSCVWKFGALKPNDEAAHIKSMVERIPLDDFLKRAQMTFSSSKPIDNFKQTVTEVCTVCQGFFRNSEQENAISLRDLTRFIEVFTFFTRILLPAQNETRDGTEFYLLDGLIVAIQLCYILRLETKQEKRDLIHRISRSVKPQLQIEGRFDYVLDKFIDNIEALEINLESASLNRPLKENLLVIWTALLTKIPAFICGKPGTSKTLSINIINSAFNAPEDKKRGLFFFKVTPKLQIRNFWGTETTTSESVEQAFEKAKTAYLQINERQSEQRSTVGHKDQPVALVFDEIGLAELSPDNPLKVLHPWLEPVTRTFTLIGLSNWKLDASKMNRVLYIARPDMEASELVETCKVRFSDEKQLKELTPHFQAFAEAFVKFRDQEKTADNTHKNFHGSRDFYSTIGILKRSLLMKAAIEKEDKVAGPRIEDLSKQVVYSKLMRNAIMRSFSGKSITSGSSQMIELYHSEYQKLRTRSFMSDELPNSDMTTIDLIYQNLLDTDSRHLMIFTESTGIEDILVQKLREFQSEVNDLPYSKFVYLAQKKGRDEMIRVTKTQLPVYTEGGFTVVLRDTQELYGCMYDLLNKNYSKSDAKDGKSRCKLFYEDTEKNVIVDPRFKIILLMDKFDSLANQFDIERKHSPPFLNRFEKYTISNSNFISQTDEKLLQELKSDLAHKKLRRRADPQGLIHNLSDELLLSVVIAGSSQIQSKLEPKQADMARIKTKKFQWAVQKILLPEDAVQGQSELKRSAMSQQAVAQGYNPDLIYRLYSRNMVIIRASNFDCYSLSNIDENWANFRERFLRTHPFDDLVSLANDAIQGRSPAKHSVIFTYSTYSELRETANKSVGIDFQVQIAAELHAEMTSDKGQHLQRLISDSKKVLVIAFREKQEWKLMQHLKYWISTIAGSEQKAVIFTAHYSETDTRNGEQLSSPISYFTQGWTMVTIDDLAGSHYRELFELLKSPISSMVQASRLGLSKDGNPEETNRSLVRECLRKLILRNLPDFDSISRGNRVVDLLTSRLKIIEHFAKQLSAIRKQPSKSQNKQGTETDSKNELTPSTLVEQVISPQEFSQLFQIHNDLLETIRDRVRAFMLSSLDEYLDEFASTFSFSLLAKVTILPKEDKDKIVEGLELVITSDTPESAHLEEILAKVQEVGVSNMKLKMEINKASIQLKHETPAMYQKLGNSQENRNRFNQAFQNFLTSPNVLGSFSKIAEANKAFGTRTEYLGWAALFLFEKYYQNSEVAQSESLHQLLILAANRYLKEVLRSSCQVNIQTLAATMILLYEVFSEELHIQNVFLESFEPSTRAGPCAGLVNRFIETGVFKVAEHLGTLFQLREYHEQGELQKMLKNLEIRIKLASRISQPGAMGESTAVDKSSVERTNSTDQDFLCTLLSWMSRLETQGDKDAVRLLFNTQVKQFHLNSSATFAQFGLIMLNCLSQSNCKVTARQRHQIIDNCLGTLHKLSKSPEASSLLLVCQTLANRITDTQKGMAEVQSPLAVLSKIMEICILGGRGAEQVTTLVQQTIAKANLTDEVKQNLVFTLNYQMVNSVHREQSPTQKAARRAGFMSSGLDVMRQMIEQPQSMRILNVNELNSIVTLKEILWSWRTNQPNEVSPDLKARLQATIRNLMRNQVLENMNGLPLLLTQAFYITFGGLAQLEANSVSDIADLVRPFTIESDGFILPTQERHQAGSAELNTALSEAGHQGANLSSFDHRFMAWNAIIKPSLTQETKRRIIGALTQTPRYAAYLTAVEAALRGQPRLEATSMPIYHLVSMAINLMEGLQERFIYSRAHLAGNAFIGMINWESPRDRQILKLLYLKERTGTSIFTSFYQCTHPQCGFITLVANCGRLGSHAGEANTVAVCSGTCGRQVGDFPRGDPRNNHLTPISEQQLQALRQNMRNADANRFALEAEGTDDDSRNLDENWVMSKYPEITDRGAALFVYLIQHLLFIASTLQNATGPINTPFQPWWLRLISRELNSLQQLLVKDEQTMLIWLQICLFHIQSDLSRPDSPSLNNPHLFRQYLVRVYTQQAASFVNVVEEYNSLRSRVSNAETEKRLRVLNFINGNHSDQKVRELYPNLRNLSKLLRPKQPIKVQDVVEQLYNLKVAGSLEAEFLWEIQNYSNIIRDTQTILGTLRDFSNMLSQNFNYYFSKDDCDYPLLSKKKKRARMALVSSVGQSGMITENSQTGSSGFSAKTPKHTLAAIFQRRKLSTKEFKQPNSASVVKKQVKHKNKRNGWWARNHERQQELEQEMIQVVSKQIQPARVDFEDYFVRSVRPMIETVLKPLVKGTKDALTDRMTIGCERANTVLEVVLNMDDPENTGVVAYVVPNLAGETDSSQHMVSFKVFVDSILAIQNQLIEKFRELAPFLPKLTRAKKNFFNCHNEEFMSLKNISIEHDLLENSYYILAEGSTDSTLEVNTRSLVSNWAVQFFSQIQDIIVNHNFNFSEQQTMSLEDYCDSLESKYKINFATDPNLIRYAKHSIETRCEEVRNLLLISVHQLHNKQPKEDQTLFDIVPEGIQDYESDKLLKSIKISHLRLLSEAIQLQHFYKVSRAVEKLAEELEVNRCRFNIPRSLRDDISGRNKLRSHLSSLKMFFTQFVTDELLRQEQDEPEEGSEVTECVKLLSRQVEQLVCSDDDDNAEITAMIPEVLEELKFSMKKNMFELNRFIVDLDSVVRGFSDEEEEDKHESHMSEMSMET